jgi:BASS family bile acid:Na+ symporter
MRHWQWPPGGARGVQPSIPLLLLALILFSAALLTEAWQIRSVLGQPQILIAALLAVWIGPALLVTLASAVVPWVLAGGATDGLLVGLALVAAMPVANSSVGWTQNVDGNLALGLALVVLSISLSPLVTPGLLTILGMTLAPHERSYCEALVNEFSGWFFVIWVVLPTAAGFVCRYLVAPRQVAAVHGWLAIASAVALLVLNYINSAVALPELGDVRPALLVTTFLLTAALSVVGLMLGWAIARAVRAPTSTRDALMFGLSMKHTGLALILAGTALPNQPLAILMIVLATLMQHLLAGLVQWWLARYAAASSPSA